MSQFESLLWERPTRGTSLVRDPLESYTTQSSSLTEWTARPLGRLGRPLLADIEAYLQFFAIARTEDRLARSRP